MTISRSDRQQWIRFFERAIQGVSTRPVNANFIVRDSISIAEEAMKELEKRFPPEHPPPLFEPLLKEHAAKQAKDDDDSTFSLAR